MAAVDEAVASARAAGDYAAVDEALAPVVTRAAAGDRVALEFLLRCIDQHRLTQAPIRKLLVDEGDVEDAAQTTLLAVTRAIGSFEGRARFTTWLYRIAEREALQVLRRRKRVTAPEGEDLSALTAEVRRLSSVVVGADAIRKALEELDPRFREPVVLRDIEGLEYTAIAERLDIPLNTVKTRILRGRQMMADRIMAQVQG
jgi:RNA polymerase sigma-70 factor (ECF subfamily)